MVIGLNGGGYGSISCSLYAHNTEAERDNKTGEGENSKAVLNLNQAENNEGVSDTQFLVEIGNTFIENFELASLKIQVNGKDMAGAENLSYVTDFESVE